jgi:uncharacterized protein YhaN
MKHVAVCLIVTVLAKTIGFAGTVDLKDMITELMQQQKQMDRMTVKSADLDKQKATLSAKDTTIKKSEKDVQAKRQEWIMDNNANEAKKAEAIQSGCRPGQTTTDTALAARCNQLAAQINNTTDRLQTRGERIVAQNTQNTKDREQLTKDTLAWAASKKHVNAVIDDLNARIAGLKQFLSAHCTSIPANATDEEIKHNCGNVQFDGAAPNLPACQTEECRQYEKMYSAR